MAQSFIKKNALLAFIVFLSLSWAHSAYSLEDLQSNDERGNTSLKEENYGENIEAAKESETLAGARPQKKEMTFLTGGRVSATYKYYRNIDNQQSQTDFLKWSWSQEASYWLYLNYQSTHSVYVRLYDTYITRGVGDNYTGIGADHEGPSFSQAYYQLNLNKKFNTPLRLTVGRQYLFSGTGVAYAAIHDGFQIEGFKDPFYVKGFIAKTKPREDNIDYSVPGFDKEGERSFMGGEIAYTGVKNVSAYIFALNQHDLSSSNPENPRQNFHYNSFYSGCGFSMQPEDDWQIWSEFIQERGSGFTDSSRTSLRETKIRSWASVSGIQYTSQFVTHPTAGLSYARGSGDDDRTRITNTRGGDLDGVDKNFLYFGYYQTGYASQLRLSNLNIVKLEGSLKPLENYSFFNMQNIVLGSRYYHFFKDRSAGGVSDTEAIEDNKNIGDEFNLYINWKFYKNMLLNTRYGIFFPGEAYPEYSRDETHYFSTSVSYNF